jgi:hypothetical protein
MKLQNFNFIVVDQQSIIKRKKKNGIDSWNNEENEKKIKLHNSNKEKLNSKLICYICQQKKIPILILYFFANLLFYLLIPIIIPYFYLSV